MNTLIAHRDVEIRVTYEDLLKANGHSVRVAADLTELLTSLQGVIYGFVIIQESLMGGGMEKTIKIIRDHQPRAQLWVMSGGETDSVELLRLNLVKPDMVVYSPELTEYLRRANYIKGLPEVLKS